MTEELSNKKLGYKQAFLFLAILPLIGFVIELLTGSKGFKIPKSPVNIYILLAIILCVIYTHLFLSKHRIFKWFSSVPIAVAVISYTTILVLFMALIPQNEAFNKGIVGKFGLSHISKNPAFLITSIFLLYSLGLVILRRLNKFTLKNAVFFLNHFGLWIVVAVAGFGSSDLMRLKMETWENSQPQWIAYDNEKMYELPIAIELIDFQIEEFNPEIALVDNLTGSVIIDDKNKIQMIEKGKNYYLNDIKIEVVEFYEQAMRIDTNYYEFYEAGAAPAAKIKVYDKNNNLIANEWISSETIMQSTNLVKLDEKYSVGLLPPSPEKYSSKVTLFDSDGTKIDTTIEVNKPFKFKGWKIYQLSYDEQMGRWSELSVFELVRDPWISVVYVGIFMLLAGSVYLFWIGKKTQK